LHIAPVSSRQTNAHPLITAVVTFAA